MYAITSGIDVFVMLIDTYALHSTYKCIKKHFLISGVRWKQYKSLHQIPKFIDETL